MTTEAPASAPRTGLVRAIRAVQDADLSRRVGRVSDLIGLIIEATGVQVEIGEVCMVGDGRDRPSVACEVVGFRGGRTLLMPLGGLHGIGPGTSVFPTGSPFRVAVGEPLLGRVIDGLGNPLDGFGPPADISWRSTEGAPPDPLSRPRISDRVSLGVRALDTLVPCGRGQRLGIFAGSGVGKSSLMGMIARSTSADVNVIALVGERGREVREFIERDLGDALSHSIVVVATSDQPALVRIRAAFTATAIAEYFRDAVRSILDGHVVLTRSLAHAGHYPAIDVLQSVSRLIGDIVEADVRDAGTKLRSALAAYREKEDLISIGAYQPGTDPVLDAAIALRSRIDAFLRQRVDEPSTLGEADAQLLALADELTRRIPVTGGILDGPPAPPPALLG